MRTLFLAIAAVLLPCHALAQPAALPRVRSTVDQAQLRAQPVQPVTNDGDLVFGGDPLAVTNKPNGDPAMALDSVSAYSSSAGTVLSVPAVLYSISVTLTAGQGPGRMMMWDSPTVPPDGALTGSARPMRCFYVDAGDRTATFSSASGIALDVGMSWAFSTGANCSTKTAAGTDQVTIAYKIDPEN